MRLKDRVAVVTGGGTGLGRAIALLFAREGAKVVLMSRREDPLRATASVITEAGGEAIAAPGDVTSLVDVQRVMRIAVDRFGGISVLVNSAGIMASRTTVADCSPQDWRCSLDVNVTGVFYCCKHALPELIKTRGNVIVVSSIYGLLGGPERAAYVASKGALVSLTRGMAIDFAPWGVRANVICPSYIETDMNREFLADLRGQGRLDALIRRHPLGAIGRPDDVAFAALYLASDEAQWVTGVALTIDGGFGLGAE